MRGFYRCGEVDVSLEAVNSPKGAADCQSEVPIFVTSWSVICVRNLQGGQVKRHPPLGVRRFSRSAVIGVYRRVYGGAGCAGEKRKENPRCGDAGLVVVCGMADGASLIRPLYFSSRETSRTAPRAAEVAMAA